MLTHVKQSLWLLATMTFVTGFIYPATITLLAQLLFPFQSNGSLISLDDQWVGSQLVGQSFERGDLFWGRLSATGGSPYNATASGGSNLGVMHPLLLENARARITKLTSSDTSGVQPQVPVDLVTASGSGLDPHISPSAAEFQVARVAKARKVSAEEVRRLVAKHTESRQFGILGEPRINVLMLNLDLDRSLPPSNASSVTTPSGTLP